jgi:acetaldehyde dehydrogenase (acetylating)
LKKPAFRIVVNSPTTHGSIGLSTGLEPAMTLGCGGYGGNITSDNIGPRHLLNIKRLAYEIRPYTRTAGAAPASSSAATHESSALVPKLPQAPAKPPAEPITAATLTRRIDAFLASRGIAGAAPPSPSHQVASSAPPATSTGPPPVAFVCEEDVRIAVKAGTKILVGEKTIITPAARDAGEAAGIFVWPSYRS